MITVEIPEELIKEITHSPLFKLYMNEKDFIRSAIREKLRETRLGKTYKITWDEIHFAIFETPPGSKQYTVITTLSESQLERLYKTLNPSFNGDKPT